MAQQTKITLKSWFETGDIPTQAQFADFIDSYPNIQDVGFPVIARHFGIVQQTTIGTALTTLSDIFTIPANELSVDGQSLEFEAWGLTDTGTNQKQFAVRSQSLDLSVNFPAPASGGKSWRLKGTLTRLDTNTALMAYEVSLSMASPSGSDKVTAVVADNAFAYDFTSADSLEIRARAYISGSVTFYGWNIKKFAV